MTEQPNPEPQKSKSEAAPKSASSPRSVDPLLASAYVPLPGRRPGKSRGLLALAALIAAGALTGVVAYYRAPAGPPPTAIAAARSEKTIVVTDADISVAATERVRGEPAVAVTAAAAGGAVSAMGDQGVAGSGAKDDGGAVADPVAPPLGAPGAAPAEQRASSPLPIAPQELVSPAPTAPQSMLTPRGHEAVRSDGFAIFSMRLIDDVAEDGDVVQVSIDGVPMSYLSLSHGGATLEIPLKKGESHRVTITAVRDGTGGVTLGLQTTAGTFLSRTMAVGESENWVVDYK